MHEATKHEFHVLTLGYHLSGIKILPWALKFYLWSLELWCPRCSFQPDTLCLSKLTAFGTSVPKTKNSWAAPKTFPVQPPGSNKKWWKQDRAEHKAERGRARKKERDTCFFFVTVYTNIQICADTRCKIAHGNHFYTPSSSASPSTHEHTQSLVSVYSSCSHSILENFPRTTDTLGSPLLMTSEALGSPHPQGAPATSSDCPLRKPYIRPDKFHKPSVMMASSDNSKTQWRQRHVSLGPMRTNKCYCDWQLLLYFCSTMLESKGTTAGPELHLRSNSRKHSAEQEPLCSNLACGSLKRAEK